MKHYASLFQNPSFLKALTLRRVNPDCNYLAYLRNQCYGLRKFNYFCVLKMSAFGRLRQGFAAATAATALFAAPAYAQDRPTMDEAPPCGVVEVEGYEHGAACATPGYETPRTLDDILADDDLSQSVVLHFGPGHLDADLVAADLRVNENVPIVAIPGGPDHAVQVVIMGFTTDRLIFDQSAQNGGRVGSIALVGYQRRLEALRTAAATTTSASLINVSAAGGPGGSQ